MCAPDASTSQNEVVIDVIMNEGEKENAEKGKRLKEGSSFLEGKLKRGRVKKKTIGGKSLRNSLFVPFFAFFPATSVTSKPILPLSFFLLPFFRQPCGFRATVRI